MTEVPNAPTTCISNDDEKYTITIELPKLSKEDIDLEVTRKSIIITVPEYGSEYSPNFDLKHEIAPEKVKATFEDGLLKIEAPLSSTLKRSKVKID
ncbi:hypothetical protein AKJ62_04570 [candidate division MSBL1 archaeon SCGC-AAA259D14]|uniref:Uncharacterized protein n=5 Tax=candidate division MSBL1 TaxID=215777 RepID=A0A133USM4_9EURY|nr:hypothetical protein AKJ62_04570 [candidate division MSBL1 archaeon SCGC-AAA259D14]KXA92943.1 hypothetical protein AKJ66_03160 [candidate division MSBL1 archaeon SCGC-AAA259E22]KXA95184.1 hypothetical protein AKJ36_01285 [candidate division MSBL1 archaeon SCGC-AAA259I07]KXA97116.1 hypothetical protein AKJ38_01930 [candidate division MSBL1 archaeon SCGC-AAA259I14]KXA98382.1 hypothetical protein AKJ39_02165 [candidate division MSBL1 archaeon SCGC-AAA259J03]